MSGAAPDRPEPTPHIRWLPFALLCGLMGALCLAGALSGPVGLHPLKLPWLGSLPAGRFVAVWAATWVVSLCLLLEFPRGLRQCAATSLIVCTALLFRLALLPHPPSDDVNRYLWEGRLVAEGISPYRHCPLDPALAEQAAEDPFHAGINHPDMSAAYPPFVLLLFSLVARTWYSPMAVKVLMIACDLGTLCFLLALLRRRGLDPRWALLYAFNPVALYSFAGQAHFDALQGFFLLGALFWYGRKRWVWMFLFAGLAVQSKYVAVLALPFLVRRENIAYAPVALAAMILPYAPFASSDGGGLFSSVVAFGEEFAFNGSIHGVLMGLLGGLRPATTVCKVLLGGAVLFAWYRYHPVRAGRFRDDPVPGSFFVLGATLALAPTVHAWYLGWILPFIALRPSGSWLVLTLTAGCYFITVGIYHHTGEWRLPRVAQVVEWLPFWLLLLREAQLAWLRRKTPARARPLRSVSVIVPARNEAARIGACIRSVLTDSAVSEAIVVDGGSSDDTVAAAAAAGARTIRHTAPPDAGGGRGGQCAAGLNTAQGDVVAIVHADTRITGPVFSRALQVLNRDAGVVGGAVGSVFDGPGLPLRIVEFCNDLRAAFLGIAFGDQIQFFRRAPVVRQGAFPAIPLMEDVELSARLRELGRTVYLFGDAVVSARAWQSGRFARAVLVVRLVAAYLWRRRLGRADPVAMYRRYYGP